MSGESVILFIGGKLQSAFCQPLAFSFGEFKQYRAAQGVVMKKAVDVSADHVTVGAESSIAVGADLLGALFDQERRIDPGSFGLSHVNFVTGNCRILGFGEQPETCQDARFNLMGRFYC